MKTFYCCADVHACYKEWRQSLKEAGFDDDKSGILIHLGDLFDRGEEAVECYEYARELESQNRGIFLRGNHTEFLIAFLEKRDSYFNYRNNGLCYTIDSFDHKTNSFEMYILMLNKREVTTKDYDNWAYMTADSINAEYPDLLPWLKSRPYFYETKHNIFSHGGIDTKTADWHQPTMVYRNMFGWRACTWVGPDYFIGWWNKTGKTCNFGHLHADLLREYLYKDLDNIGNNDIFHWKEEDTYFLDSCTILTGKVNVRVIKDTEIKL